MQGTILVRSSLWTSADSVTHRAHTGAMLRLGHRIARQDTRRKKSWRAEKAKDTSAQSEKKGTLNRTHTPMNDNGHERRPTRLGTSRTSLQKA